MNRRLLRNDAVKVDGFSLLEVLVASAVLAIVMTVLLGTLSTSLGLWRTTESKLSADREARAAELLLAQDLANIFIPSDTRLWPQTNNGYFQFLTLKPREYQSAGGGNAGDVCFVEYHVDRTNRTFTRLFYGSAQTYTNVLRRSPPGFPNPGSDPQRAQVLATNLLADARDAVRGLAISDEANSTNFVILGTNNSGVETLPFSGNYSFSNRPVAVEINFAVADAETMANPELIGDPNYKLRNAGLYSFRISLPKPLGAP